MSYKTLYACIVGLAVSSCGLSTFAVGMEIKRPSLMAAAKLGNIRLFHNDDKFIVEHDGIRRIIPSYWVDKSLRGVKQENLKKFLGAGYLHLKELQGQNGAVDYKLDACGRLNGGGPVLGFFVAVGGCVATAAATAGAAVVAAPGGPFAVTAAAYGTAVTGMALTAKATIAAGAAPTP